MTEQPAFESYYGRPILKEPVWKTPDVPLYLFLGGLGGGSALLAEGAALTGRPGLERLNRVVASLCASGGTVALIHDLGRPERFLHMLRVLKVTSPLSVGSYVLAPFAALSTAATASHLTGRLPRLGRTAGLGAAALGPLLATYTAALFSNTAVPAWHEAHRELPYVFGGSGAAAAGGLAMALAPYAETGPAVRMAALGATVDLTAMQLAEHRLGMLAEPYQQGPPGRLMKAARAMTLGALATTGFAEVSGSRWLRRLAGVAYVAGSVTLRFGVFEAGRASARDPKYVVVPQRARLEERERERAQAGTMAT